MGNITKAILCKARVCRTAPLYQYDYGQILQIVGPELPSAYEVHFSNQPHGTATTQIGSNDGVAIPDAYLQTGSPVYAWLYLHTGENDGETEYSITIPVITRARPTNETPTPVQQDAITEAIAALNTAVAEAQEAITHYPKVVDGYWYVWNVTDSEYVTTGVKSTGEDGDPGTPGQYGVSPTIIITDITGGHRVTITDATGPHNFDVMDGDSGAIFTPAVSAEGVISWTNNGGLPNPESVNIKGAPGDTYMLTSQDKSDIANIVISELPTWTGGSY